MDLYLFYGVVLPEHAQLSLQCELEFSHVSSGVLGKAKVSVVLNQAAVWIESDHDWDIFDLRNIVKNIVQTQLAMISLAKGFAYNFEVTRVLNSHRGIDWVFGVDIPVLAKRGADVDLSEALARLRDHTAGSLGIFVSRCLADLVSAMQNAEDTGFYCYRSIESLRHHCAARFDLTNSDKSTQWQKFRDVSGATEETLRAIKASADPLRHGEAAGGTSEDRANLFAMTWDVVDGYLLWRPA